MSTAGSTVAVVGGGISGLAATWELLDRGLKVILLERSGRAGGVIQSAPFAGRTIDLGPDAFLARRPEATAFAREVGLGGDLVSPAVGSPSLWVDGTLRRLPEGLLLGLPADLPALARSKVLSRRGLLRAAADLVLPGAPVPTDGPDPAVGPLVRARLGDEAHERLVDPLLGGINAGDSDVLSLRAGVPQLAGAVAGHRSLVVAAVRARRKAGRAAASAPVFHSVRGGLGKLPERALRGAIDRRAQVVLGFDVDRIERRVDGSWSVIGGAGARFQADGVVVAVPAAEAARLVEPHAGRAAALLGDVGTASVAIVCLAYAADDVEHPLDGSGFLVPRREGRLITACSWASSKWPDVARPGTVVLRASVGRAGEDRGLALDDATLVRRVHAEVAAALGVRGEPTAERVARWPGSFPQYAPGHAERIVAVHADLPAGLELAGASYQGVGIPACIASGRAAARRAAGVEGQRPG